ncbi:MAG TPA: MBL fold metallo-hydrolase, partial [Candidatus Micrarchaeota archaeon]|nr:MBL fold metallo-hydrolase [Candidatus Micrarchaeota archaeon]
KNSGRPFTKPQPCKIDAVLEEGHTVAGMEVISTPGHTPGSISLFDRQRKAMFVGDTMRTEDGMVVGPPEHFTLDMGMAADSNRKIAEMDFEFLLPGHGAPLFPQASKKAREYMDSA